MYNKLKKNRISKEDEIIIKRFFHLRESEKYNEALETLSPLIKRYSDNYKILFLYGSTFYQNNDFIKAILFLRKAVKLNQSHELSSMILFHSLMNIGKVHTAIREMRRYLLLKPKKCKEHYLTLLEMKTNINKFSTSEKNAIMKLFKEFDDGKYPSIADTHISL